MTVPSMMGRRVVIAPDKFKGSLTAGQAARAMALGVKRANPELTTVECPVADGGDGTLDTAVAAGFERVPVYATGPTGQVVLTAYARSGETAVVEMAEVCGLQRLPGAKAAPMTASSYGLGEVVAQALDHGCRDIIIGVGGSASTDGGAGFLAALGAIARDEHGSRLDSGGRHIGSAAQLDVTGLHPEIASAAFTIAVDVDNPLYGPLGAAMVYASQKGASPVQVIELDRALRVWADVVERATRTDCGTAAGAGAAGGVGFAALAVLGARMRAGIEVILDLIELDRHLLGACAAMTGEGSLDHQSLRGKAAVGVSRRAGAYGVPTFAVAGVSTLDPVDVDTAGLAGVYALSDLEPDRQRSISQAGELLALATERLTREWLCRMQETLSAAPGVNEPLSEDIISGMRRGRDATRLNNDAYRLHLPEPGSDPFENLGRRCYEAQTRELIRLAEQVVLRSRVEAEDGETEQA